MCKDCCGSCGNGNAAEQGSCCGGESCGSSWHQCCRGSIVHWALGLVALSLFAFLTVKTLNQMRYPSANVPTPLVTVSGDGEVFAKPDLAVISFSVTEEASSVAKAQTESATKMNAILAELKKQGIEEKDIKTNNYSIYPRYEYERMAVSSAYYPTDGKRSLAAYVVSQSVTIKVRDLAKAGDILSSLGELGATDLSGLSFEIDQEDALKLEARAKAIADAQEKAEAMAEAMGVKLVRVVSFNEDNYYYPRYESMKVSAAYGMGGADAAPAPELPAGENQITSRVNVTYEIR